MIPFAILMYSTPNTNLLYTHHEWILFVSYFGETTHKFYFPAKPTRSQIRKCKRMYRVLYKLEQKLSNYDPFNGEFDNYMMRVRFDGTFSDSK